MSRNCTICGEPIHLKPTAQERARRYGGKPSDYESLFTVHSHCQIEKRKQDMSEFLAREYPKLTVSVGVAYERRKNGWSVV